MSLESNKAIARQLVSSMNSGDEATFLALAMPDVVDHALLPGLAPGREGWNMNVQIVRAAFPDAHWHEEEMLAEGNLVAGRYTLTGTHRGDFVGIPATGKSISVSQIHIVRIADGKIAEHWGHGDDIGMMRQLGALP